jgi:hypothetical protein
MGRRDEAVVHLLRVLALRPGSTVVAANPQVALRPDGESLRR